MSDIPVLVHRLRLQAGRDAPVQALRARGEDALRTSSKPALLAHRFVLLRRLRLRLPQGASAQSLALQLQAQWRAIEALAQPIEQASSPPRPCGPPTRCRRDSCCCSAGCRGGRRAWFWPRLLPGLRLDAPLPQRLQGLLFEPLAAVEPEAEAAMQRRRGARPGVSSTRRARCRSCCSVAAPRRRGRDAGRRPVAGVRDQAPVQREPATATRRPASRCRRSRSTARAVRRGAP